MANDGRARIEVVPKGDITENETIRKFARAVLAAEPNAAGEAIGILESGETVVSAFFQAGGWALFSISILLWIVLRRFGDVLLTLVPLVLAGVLTLEICVLIDFPMNFANIIALPLLLGVGVAFKIYYVMAWRAGQTELLQIEPDAGGGVQRADDRDRVRQPVVLQPSRNVEHGQAAGAVAGDHDAGSRPVPAGPDGPAAREGEEGIGTREGGDLTIAAGSSCVRALIGAGGGLLHPGPGFAVADQAAEDAALDPERVAARKGHVRLIDASVLRIVDPPVPFVRSRLLHPHENDDAGQRPAALGRIGVLGVDARLLLPIDRRVVAVGAQFQPHLRGAVGDQPVSGRVVGAARTGAGYHRSGAQRDSRAGFSQPSGLEDRHRSPFAG